MMIRDDISKESRKVGSQEFLRSSLPAFLRGSFVLVLVLVLGCDGGAPAPAAPPAAPAPAPPAAATDANLLARGRALYDVHCAACHGAEGDGRGAAAYLLSPRPRDFTRGSYRLISTADRTPTDEDLFRTITRGMPGSAMPSWAHLPEADRRALVALVKSFAPERFEGAREPIAVPPETRADAASVARGRAAYEKSCMPCHGPTGKGDGQQVMVDDEERPTRPRDITRGIFKGEAAARDIFLRVRAGLPGSPMPSSSGLSDAEVWDVVHYVRSLVPAGVDARVVHVRRRIVAKRVAKAPEGPEDAAWSGAAGAEVALMPLSWRDERPETVAVAALHDGKSLAIRLAWSSPRAPGPGDFRDGAAVQIATTPEEPSIAMGHAGAPVEILYWKSPNPDAGVRAVDDAFEAGAGLPDLYAAREAENPVAAVPDRRPVCVNEAEGFGTLAVRPAAAQKAAGGGVREGEGWRIAIVRPLGKPGERGADVRPGGSRPVAFAVWQGAFQDRNGQKNVSIWHDLVLEE